jgi:DNA-binding winged helix-turn-helix (wHTH) protein
MRSTSRIGNGVERVSTGIVRFGTFELDRYTGELRRSGLRVRFQDQPARLLSLLVSRPGEVVTRAELRRALWADDTFVEFDTAVNVAVHKIRLALRDSARSPRFVETVPRRGYRFLAEVQAVAPRRTSVGVLAAAVAAVAAAAIGLAWW